MITRPDFCFHASLSGRIAVAVGRSKLRGFLCAYLSAGVGSVRASAWVTKAMGVALTLMGSGGTDAPMQYG